MSEGMGTPFLDDAKMEGGSAPGWFSGVPFVDLLAFRSDQSILSMIKIFAYKRAQEFRQFDPVRVCGCRS